MAFEIFIGSATFIGIVISLVLVILAARARLVPAGEALLSGSASIHHSLRCAAAVARLLASPYRVRAVLGVPGRVTALDLPEGVAALDHAPFSKLFPRAAAVVHQGGIGSIGQLLRAGRPQLVVPFAVDQPDNALRVQRLGVAEALYPRRYAARRVTRRLGRLREDATYACRAAGVAR
jgi:UDP:flavonoid glycosyltransferase YjiC (YdhE family)